MAAARWAQRPPSARASGTPNRAGRLRAASAAMAGATPGPRGEAEPAWRVLDLSQWRGAEDDEGRSGSEGHSGGSEGHSGAEGRSSSEGHSGGSEGHSGAEERSISEGHSGAEGGSGAEGQSGAACRTWEAGQPTAAAALLSRCLAAGVVSQVRARGPGGGRAGAAAQAGGSGGSSGVSEAACGGGAEPEAVAEGLCRPRRRCGASRPAGGLAGRCSAPYPLPRRLRAWK